MNKFCKVHSEHDDKEYVHRQVITDKVDKQLKVTYVRHSTKHTNKNVP